MSDTKQCHTCGGRKWIQHPPKYKLGSNQPYEIDYTQYPCPTCHGWGKLVNNTGLATQCTCTYDTNGHHIAEDCPIHGLATSAAEPKGQLVDLRPQDTQNKLRAFMAEYGVASPTWGVSTDDGDFISELAYFIAAERRSAIEDFTAKLKERCFPARTDGGKWNVGVVSDTDIDETLKEQTK